MCGIIASIKTKGLYNYILEGLKKEDYRGYDSCGLGYLKNDRIQCIKALGQVDNLKDKIDEEFEIAIAHTRWATHGKNEIKNAHPHTSNHDLFAIVHNGTIYNYLEIKKELINLGFTFKSDTDTEVIANLLEYEYGLTLDVNEAIYNVMQKLEGTYALCILFCFEKRIYFAKNNSPLTLGIASNSLTLVSDINALQNEERYIDLDDQEYGYITNKNYVIYKNHKKKNKKISLYKKENEEVKNLNYEYFMEKEIYEIPFKIKNLLNNLNMDEIKPLHDLILKSKRIVLVGSGTSYHACLYAKTFFDKEVETIIASELYTSSYKVNKKDFYIFLSQSGETMDVLKSLEYVSKSTNKTLSITNVNNSTLSKKTTYSLLMYAGKEVSVASTKAYINELVLLYILSKNDNITLNTIKEYENILIDENDILRIKNIALSLKDKKNAIYIGKGNDYYLAKEASLKLKEVSYIHSEAMYAGELKHGPIALIDDGFPVFVIEDTIKNKHLNSAKEEIKSRGGIIHNFFYDHKHPLNMIKTMMELFLLAFYTSFYKNNEIDKPRNLAKSVTVE